MTKLNRRRFLQATSAVGAAALVPAMPVYAATTSRTGSASQMLWASLYSKAENAKEFAGITKVMGMSQGVSNRLHTQLCYA